MKDLVILGASGLIGSEFVARTTDPVIAVHRSPMRSAPATAELVPTKDLFTLDWVGAVPKTATILHCAGLSNPRLDDRNAALVEAQGNIRMIEELQYLGWTGHLVLLSSAAVYGNPGPTPITETARTQPVSSYGKAKLGLERSIHAHLGPRLTILRLSSVYGSDMAQEGQGVIKILKDAIRSEASFNLYGNGLTARDYLHVSDVCAALLSASRTCPGGVLNIGTGRATTTKALLDLTRRITGRPLRIRAHPAAAEAGSTVLDPSKARGILTWQPKITLEDGLRRYFKS
ncbi:NAD-dependent epimerase/dehydratase family protein [Aestuariibius insulae]|uniref:NAD-dependent epimerase/dehydratase family protein n=1 Tax=Aestuariibius insulae TaxID=2058287 RepID=UPI00345E9D02